jgi:hypothetical protein
VPASEPLTKIDKLRLLLVGERKRQAAYECPTCKRDKYCGDVVRTRKVFNEDGTFRYTSVRATGVTYHAQYQSDDGVLLVVCKHCGKHRSWRL